MDAPVNTSATPRRYTGRRVDPETGLYYYRARYYSPKLGRFLQTDPIGTKDDLNLYAYVGNDPQNKNDPRGRGGELVVLPVVLVTATAISSCAAIPSCTEYVGEAAAGFLEALGSALQGTRSGSLLPPQLHNESTEDGDENQSDGPDVPDDLVGEVDDKSKYNGSRWTNGKLRPDRGGVGDPDKDFETLTGGLSGPAPSSYPPGTRIGQNGIVLRPGRKGGPSRIDIPSKGDKPRETLHY